MGEGGGVEKIEGGGGEKGREAHSSYSRHQIPSDTLTCLFPSNTFLPKTYYFSQHPASENLPEE